MQLVELLEVDEGVEPINLEKKKKNKKKLTVTWGDEQSKPFVEIGEALEYDRKLQSYQKKSRRKFKVEFCSRLQIKIFIGVGVFLAIILIILLVLIFTLFI